MPYYLRFTPIEILPQKIISQLPLSLKIIPSVIYKSMSFRLLSGNLDIKCEFSGETLQQRNNYLLLPFEENKRLSLSLIRKSLFPHTIKSFDKSVLKNRSRNFKFHRELFFEFCHYFYQKSKNNHIASFVHIYRILERISYCIPLMWASKSNNFEGTFNKLQSFFKNKSELDMFDIFVRDIIPSTVLDINVDFNIVCQHYLWSDIYYKTLEGVLDKNVSNTNYPSLISTTNRNTIKMIISIRNRYFHFLTGKEDNFDSESIIDPNEFFGIINENLFNWLSFIYFEALTYELE